MRTTTLDIKRASNLAAAIMRAVVECLLRERRSLEESRLKNEKLGEE